MVAPILNTYPTKNVQEDYLSDDACNGSSNVWKASYDYFLGVLSANGFEQAVAVGSDFNGFVHSPSPRFGKKACDGDKVQARMQINPVEYPFESFDGKVNFNRFKSGRKLFDINFDGLSNVGLLPDFIEDLKNVGLSKQEITPSFI